MIHKTKEFQKLEPHLNLAIKTITQSLQRSLDAVPPYTGTASEKRYSIKLDCILSQDEAKALLALLCGQQHLMEQLNQTGSDGTTRYTS